MHLISNSCRRHWPNRADTVLVVLQEKNMHDLKTRQLAGLIVGVGCASLVHAAELAYECSALVEATKPVYERLTIEDELPVEDAQLDETFPEEANAVPDEDDPDAPSQLTLF